MYVSAKILEQIFLSTLSLRRATRLGLLGWLRVLISIHALLAESDSTRIDTGSNIGDFYPRSPCGERPPITFRHCTTYLFLSTLSLRRATTQTQKTPHFTSYFYPRSPCGERHGRVNSMLTLIQISIHALLAESDKLIARHSGRLLDFYPRSPCGERRVSETLVPRQYQFLSTLSLRRATGSTRQTYRKYEFLSTLSLRRATHA